MMKRAAGVGAHGVLLRRVAAMPTLARMEATMEGKWVASDEYHRSSTRFHTTNRPALHTLETVQNPRYEPKSLGDRVAFGLVRMLRVLSDQYFGTDYVRRAVMLETVAAVPGMVGSVMHHLWSLRKAKPSHWIKPLMDEAENERMHLMSMVEIWQPSPMQRATIFGVQMAMVTGFTGFYALFPRTAHRFVGHLEEEAVITYTHFLHAIDQGAIPNVPAPKIARDYWSLPSDATLRDLVLVIRADETDHRDVNHLLADPCADECSVLNVNFVTPAPTDVANPTK